MSWIDESRRTAFELGERNRASGQSKRAGLAGVVGELEQALPSEMRKRGIVIGNELILGYDDALAAIRIATEHRIAVLGFDAGEIGADGFRSVDYSGYETSVAVAGDWNAYASAMNVYAREWITEHQLGRNHGYILTSASEREHAQLETIRKAR